MRFGDCVAVCAKGVRSTEPAGTMTGSEGDGLIEEKEGSPVPWSGQRRTPILVAESASDPQVAAVMADYLTIFVDETAAVAGKHSATGGHVEVAERIDPVADRHIADCDTPWLGKNRPLLVPVVVDAFGNLHVGGAENPSDVLLG